MRFAKRCKLSVTIEVTLKSTSSQGPSQIDLRAHKQIKMTTLFILADDVMQRKFRRERVFRNRTNPQDFLTDTNVIERYRLPKEFCFRHINLVRETPTGAMHFQIAPTGE